MAAEERGVRFADKAVNFVSQGQTIRPLRDQILVKPLPVALGDRIQADWHGQVLRGIVTAAGPGCYPNIHARGFKDGKPYHTVRQSKVFRATELKIGDVVELGGREIGGYLFPKVWFDGDWCVICREADVAIVHG